MSKAKQPIAKYKLQIKSTTGYSSTTTGECTPEQYSAALAAIDSACSSGLVRAAPDLLLDLQSACEQIEDLVSRLGGTNPDCATESYRATIAKATKVQT